GTSHTHSLPMRSSTLAGSPSKVATRASAPSVEVRLAELARARRRAPSERPAPGPTRERQQRERYEIRRQRLRVPRGADWDAPAASAELSQLRRHPRLLVLVEDPAVRRGDE